MFKEATKIPPKMLPLCNINICERKMILFIDDKNKKCFKQLRPESFFLEPEWFFYTSVFTNAVHILSSLSIYLYRA